MDLPPPREGPDELALEEAPFDDSWADSDPSSDEIAEGDRLLLGRQEELRAAAEYVAAALAWLPVVERVVLIGSVAQPLERELPRFARFRRAGVARGLNRLLDEVGFGVAHHQVDVLYARAAAHGLDVFLGTTAVAPGPEASPSPRR